MLFIWELGRGFLLLKMALEVDGSSFLYKHFISYFDANSVLVFNVGAVALLPTCKCNWYG